MSSFFLKFMDSLLARFGFVLSPVEAPLEEEVKVNVSTYPSDQVVVPFTGDSGAEFLELSQKDTVFAAMIEDAILSSLCLVENRDFVVGSETLLNILELHGRWVTDSFSRRVFLWRHRPLLYIYPPDGDQGDHDASRIEYVALEEEAVILRVR